MLRREQGVTQDELADLAGMCQHSLSRIERGISKPRKGTLEKLSKALGVDLLPEQWEWFTKEKST
jgi:transcriptional regulator with XRE-family HTH domain